jgi:hypothetical protein
MKKQTEFIGIASIIIALIVLVFGDNLYEQINGHSFFDKTSPSTNQPLETPFVISQPPVHLTNTLFPTQSILPTDTPIPTVISRGVPVVLTPLTLIGEWKEYWGLNTNTDVTYNDIYIITVNGDDIEMSSIGRSYYFQNILLEENKFSFRLSNSGTTIDYRLTMDVDGKTLAGQAITNNGVIAEIIWEKIK